LRQVNETLGDPEIVARVLAGDTDAFGILVDRYQDVFARYATHMMGSVDDAADVVQDSFVRAYRFLHRCEDRANFKSWLFTVVSNQCKTQLARRKRRASMPLTEGLEVAGPDDPVADALGVETKELVNRALANLSPDHREAIVLKYIEDLSLPEMAKMLGTSIPALKMRLLRARAALREKLEGVET